MRRSGGQQSRGLEAVAVAALPTARLWRWASVGLLAALLLPALRAEGAQANQPTYFCLPLSQVTGVVSPPELHLRLQRLRSAAAGAGDQVSIEPPGRCRGRISREDCRAAPPNIKLRGSLLASTADYERIREELALIRQLYPAMDAIRYTGNYAEGQLVVRLEQPSPLISTATYDQANFDYGLCSEQLTPLSDGDTLGVLQFPARINMERLALEYSPLTMPNLAEASFPNFQANIEDFIRVLPSSTNRFLSDPTLIYEFEDGWQDCIDGCDCRDIYTYETDGEGGVIFLGVTSIYLPTCAG